MRQPGDLKYSIEYFRHLRNSDLPLETLGVRPNDVTMRLVRALGARVELEAGSATQNIGEMVILCRELLTSDISGDHLAGSIVSLRDAVLSAPTITLGKTLDQVVEYMKEAIEMCPPGCQRASIQLAETLSVRFIQDKSIEIFQEAMVLFDDIIPLKETGGIQTGFLHYSGPQSLLISDPPCIQIQKI
jgi:hypothetical protein